MEKRERQIIPGLSYLLLLTLLLGLVGALLHDFKGVGFAEVGSLIWAGAVLVTFVLGTAYLSRRLLPIQGNLGWSEGFRLLWRNYMLGMTKLVAGQKRDPMGSSVPKKKKTPTSDLPLSFGIIGAGFLFSHQAAAITRGGGYSRAAGPGFVFLNPGESIGQVFDLRPQSRKQSVSATTRDGIPVETSVSVTFQVRRLSPHERRPRSIETDDIPYRYDPDALFELHYAGAMEGEERRLWTEQVISQAATLLIGEIGKYTLDQLLASGGAEPLKEVKQAVKLGLESQQGDETQQTLPRGIEIVGVGVGGLELPEHVALQRLATWQVEWQNKITEEEVSGNIEVKRLVDQARARAQMENVENLLMSIETMRHQSEAELHDLVMKRLVETLEAMTASRSLGRSGPRLAILDRAAETSGEIRQIMEQDEE